MDEGAQIERWLQRTVTALEGAKGDPGALEGVLERYLEEGEALGISPYGMRDFFDISHPGLGDRAGLGGEALEALRVLYDEVSQRRWR